MLHIKAGLGLGVGIRSSLQLRSLRRSRAWGWDKVSLELM